MQQRDEKSDNREKEMILQVGAVCGANRLMGGGAWGGEEHRRERYVRGGDMI